MTDPYVRLYEPGDEGPIRELFADAFGGDRTIEEWRWWHLERPDANPYIRIAVAGGDVVGQLANVHFRTFFGGVEGRVSQGSDLMIRHDHRGRGPGLLLSDFRGPEEPYDVRLSFPIDEVLAGFKARDEGSVFPGTLRQWVGGPGSTPCRSGRPSAPSRADDW